MRFPIHTPVFPPMKVTTDQAMQFASTCERIVDSTVEARREYVRRYNRQLKPTSWHMIKRRNTDKTDLSVYVPRRGSGVSRPVISVTSTPIMITVGTIEGTLEDVMLGVTSTNTSALRSVNSSLYKDIADSRVLARIDTPNDADPFAFLGFKWVVKAPSLKLTPLARARDFVYLESSGIRTSSSTGERIGYQLMHSVDLSCCPSLPYDMGVVRGYMSFCFLFAECGDNRVEVFCKGFVDPRGGLSHSLTISAAADVMMDCENATTSAQVKKIEWLLAQGPRSDADADAILTASNVECANRETLSTERDDSAILAAEQCEECLIHRLTRSRKSSRRSTITAWVSGDSSSTCAMCDDFVCGSCRRDVRLPGTKSPITCCTGCIDRADAVDTGSFARELAQRAMSFQGPRRRTSTLGMATHEKIRLTPIQKRPEPHRH